MEEEMRPRKKKWTVGRLYHRSLVRANFHLHSHVDPM